MLRRVLLPSHLIKVKSEWEAINNHAHLRLVSLLHLTMDLHEKALAFVSKMRRQLLSLTSPNEAQCMYVVQFQMQGAD